MANRHYRNTIRGRRRITQGGGQWPDKYVGPIASKIGFVNEGIGATNKEIMAQTHHMAMDNVANYIRVRYPNYFPETGTGAGEMNMGGSAYGRCSAYFWNGTSFIVQRLYATADNRDTCYVDDGGVFDFIGALSLVKGWPFWLRFWGHRDAGQWAYAHAKADYANKDILRYGATVTDLTGVTTDFTDTYQGALDWFGPCNILGLTQQPSLADWGDSIGVGLKAVPDGKLMGLIGTGQRMLGKRMASVNCSVPGELAATLADPVKSKGRRREAAFCSHALIEVGSNPLIANNVAAAVVMADCQKLRQDMAMPALIATIPPWTDNAGGGNASGNKRAADTNAVDFNALARAIPTGFAGLYDRASALETAGRLWQSTTYVYTDWIHPTRAGEENIEPTLSAFDWSLLGSPAAVSPGFEYASGALYQSLTFSDGWAAQQGTLSTLDTAVPSPEHKPTTATIKEDATASSVHDIFKQQTVALASTTKKVTCFVKRKAGSRNCQIQVQQNGASFASSRVQCDLGTGAVTVIEQGAGTISGQTSTLMDDGSWKIEWNCAFGSSHPASSFLYVKLAQAPFVDSYSGDNTSSISAWGFDIR